MQNNPDKAPVISLFFTNPAPGVDKETWERYSKWIESNQTLLSKLPQIKAIERYAAVNRNPEYPSNVSINHYENLEDMKRRLAAPDELSVRVRQDQAAWQKRKVTEFIWAATYRLLINYRTDKLPTDNKLDTCIENATVMHMEAYRLSEEDHKKYNIWLEEFAFNVFGPLFMRIPGLKGYDYYQYTGFRSTLETRESDCPPYLTLIYFDNIESYENFLNSPELVSFQKAVRTIFPHGISYRWYVQYQLVKSWRK